MVKAARLSLMRQWLQNRRTMQKTLSYYVMHMVVAMLVAYAVTGSWRLALTLSLLEPSVQAIAFFFHEKFWQNMPAPSQDQAVGAPA